MNILKSIKNTIRTLALGHRATSEQYIKHLRKLGATIGNNLMIFNPAHVEIDTTSPYMIDIGDEVRITSGVKILTHDWSWSVWKGITGEEVGAVGKVKIGNNVFIGNDAIILMHTDIGDNVIIGAGSVVKGKIESNSVYSGIPAKKICSLNDYINRRRNQQLQEAINIVREYYKSFKTWPPQDVLFNYFALYTNDLRQLTKSQIYELSLCGTKRKSEIWLKENKPIFNGYESFIAYCKTIIAV